MLLNFATYSIRSTPALALLENWRDFLDRIWHYLNDEHSIGNLSVSVTAIVFGILIFAAALLMSRTLSACFRGGSPSARISIPDCSTRLAG